jgi:hypothetical protein
VVEYPNERKCRDQDEPETRKLPEPKSTVMVQILMSVNKNKLGTVSNRRHTYKHRQQKLAGGDIEGWDTNQLIS